MVASSVVSTPASAAEAVCQDVEACQSLQDGPLLSTASQGAECIKVGAAAKEEDEGVQRDFDENGQDIKNNNLCAKDESKHERPSTTLQEVFSPTDDFGDRLVIVDDVKEEEDEEYEEEDDQEECGPDVADSSSPSHPVKESQGKKGRGSLAWHKKSQQTKEHANQWVMRSLLFVTTSVSVVSLSDVEKAYQKACLKEGREPLTRFGLARLIHQLFPGAGKCRIGSRGHQKIHYRNLQWKESSLPSHVKVPASENETTEETLKSDTCSEKIQGKGKESVPIGNINKDAVQNPRPKKKVSEAFRVANQVLVNSAIQPVPAAEDDDQEGCENAANRLAQVVKWVKSQGKYDVLMKTFAHSASCNRLPCCPLCLMFRRVRRHLVTARHPCYVLRIYSILLKLHVATCTSNNCGMTACPALQASRRMKRAREEDNLDLGPHQEQQEEEIQHVNKRVNLQANRPSALRMRSGSTSSVSDSEASTSSSPPSPIENLPPSPPPSFRIVPLPPLNLRPVDTGNSERRGA